MTKKYFTKIESLRGVAALFVALVHIAGFTVIVHAPQSSVALFELSDAREVAIRIIGGAISGFMAVMVFFVISGFVIGWALDRRGGASGRAYPEFLLRRAFRLYPAHVVAVCGAVLIGLMATGHADLRPYHVIEPADFADWVNGTIFEPVRLKSLIGNFALATWSMNLVAWSLYVEVCAAPLLPLFRKLSRLDNVMVDAAVLAVLIAISAGFQEILAVKYLFAFYAGMIVQTRGREWAGFVAGRTGLAAFICYLVMTVPATVALGYPPSSMVCQGVGAFGLLSLVVWHGEARVFRWLDSPVMRWGGRLSYSFYLWHFIVLRLAIHELYERLPPAFMTANDVAIGLATAVGTIAAALAIAQLSYSFVERPFISIGAMLVGRQQRAVA